jgi:hypothetical protein
MPDRPRRNASSVKCDDMPTRGCHVVLGPLVYVRSLQEADRWQTNWHTERRRADFHDHTLAASASISVTVRSSSSMSAGVCSGLPR